MRKLNTITKILMFAFAWLVMKFAKWSFGDNFDTWAFAFVCFQIWLLEAKQRGGPNG